LHRIMTNLPEPRDLFRHVLTECITRNPESIEYIALLMAFYLHVGPFSREVIGRIGNITVALEPTATSRRPVSSSYWWSWKPPDPNARSRSKVMAIQSDGRFGRDRDDQRGHPRLPICSYPAVSSRSAKRVLTRACDRQMLKCSTSILTSDEKGPTEARPDHCGVVNRRHAAEPSTRRLSALNSDCSAECNSGGSNGSRPFAEPINFD
jgi:hypothetical protein